MSYFDITFLEHCLWGFLSAEGACFVRHQPGTPLNRNIPFGCLNHSEKQELGLHTHGTACPLQMATVQGKPCSSARAQAIGGAGVCPVLWQDRLLVRHLLV